MIIDTHAHLADEKLARRVDDVVERARKAGVSRILNVGDNVERSRMALDQARRFDGVFCAVGVHPHDADEVDSQALNALSELASDTRVVAVGEIGLDYYYDNCDREVQQRAFIEQIRLAERLSLPIIVHDREAHGDTLEILKKEAAGRVIGVLHCFSGSVEFARECIDIGFYISIAGPVTFKNSRKLQEVAASVPLDRLLVETDCPYLTPVPHRGEPNEPAYVRYTAQRIAELRGIPLEQLARATTENAVRLFGLR